ncbi:MAG: tetratricopeptide repeat protein [Acidobacteria bacterium]|nr:tetratricopeptide repeat protein [Acidobacteriota bacterium]
MAAAVFVVALVVRLAHVWSLRDTPAFDILLGDARAYDAWAERLAAGDWLGGEVFYQAPLYPYLLGVLYAVAGRDLLVVRLVQAVIGAASASLLAGAAARLVSPCAGVVAGLGLALYAPAIFFDALLQKSVLDVFFMVAVLWLAGDLIARPDRTARWLALGAALGALSLTRENALAIVAVAVAWSASVSRRAWRHESEAVQRRVLRDSGFRIQPVVALTAGLLLLLTPVLVRNYMVTGGFYLTTSQFGPNFFIGNNAGADGTYMALRAGRGAPEFERQDATELAEAALGRSLTPAEVSAYWSGRARQFITGEPAAWAQLMARKVALLINRVEMLDTESQQTYEEWSPVLRLLAPIGHFGVLMPLAALGLWVLWPDRRRLWPVLAMAAAYAASVIVFYVFARYRFPLVPFLLVFASAGVTGAAARWHHASRTQRGLTIAAVVALAVLVWWPLLSPRRMRAITETNLGVALHEAGRTGDALRHLERAVTLQPDYAPAYNNLGVVLRAAGRTDEAIAAYERGLQQPGAYADLHFNLANALRDQGRTDEAAAHLRQAVTAAPADAAGAHNNLGLALAAKGQMADAAAEFRAALALDPSSVIALRNLGNILATVGDRDQALDTLRRAAALAPNDALVRYDYGSVLLEAGRYADAVAEFEAAIAADPRYVEALNNLGIAHASSGHMDLAITAFERALEIRPDFVDAKRNLDTAQRAGKKPR